MCVSKHPWPLIVSFALLCFALLFSSTHSTPIAIRRERLPTPCAHDSIAALIKKSPVILKALGAHIFTDDTRSDELVDDAMGGKAVTDGELKWQKAPNNFLASATLYSAAGPTTATETARQRQLKQNQPPFIVSEWRGREIEAASASSTSRTSAATAAAANSARAMDESILITLTPETIYKGASLLKMTPGAENAARNGGVGSTGRGDGSSTGHNGSYGTGSGGGTTAEAAYQYEGQLNATLQPLSCFDRKLLKILPTELIIFGKLITGQQQQQQQQRLGELHTIQQMDILSISINGLHRWSPQFENYIWKHLGWDDWSDFTICSVACGKGVQQRFRRCLLDNPMVNFNMQLNLNTDADEEDDEDVIDDDTLTSSSFDDNRLQDNEFGGFNGIGLVAPPLNSKRKQQEQQQKTNDKDKGNKLQHLIENVATMDNTTALEANTVSDTVTTVKSNEYSSHKINRTHKSYLSETLAMRSDLRTKSADDRVDDSKSENGYGNNEFLRTFQGSRRVKEDTFFGNSNIKFGKEATKDNGSYEQSDNKTPRQKKRRKPTKNYSTMFCEGYNIEQRNCNAFECSDDISDLLKFYKKFSMPEDVVSPAAVAMQSSSPAADSHTTTAITVESPVLGPTMTVSSGEGAPAVYFAGITTRRGATSPNGNHVGFGSGASISARVRAIHDVGTASGAGSSLSGDTTNTKAAASTTTLANPPPSTTPANMGYIRSWPNPLNFTIMLTLRVRNDSKTASTIFSIRNTTHNLYLESCKDGLRLYLERDSTTEMLPLKFNIYDYRWHQVAISIQNGDFISIYVDCSWTNSFVVSKRLYMLPLNADVEIGRGFNGELQQLLVLPDNQERQQCSNKRISINEVKRYIIDTFIGDYGN